MGRGIVVLALALALGMFSFGCKEKSPPTVEDIKDQAEAAQQEGEKEAEGAKKAADEAVKDVE